MSDLPAVLLPWAGTYLIHSTILLALAWGFGRVASPRLDAARELAWRTAITVPLVTASAQSFLGASVIGGRLLDLPLRAVETGASAISAGHARGLTPPAGLEWALLSLWAAVACVAVLRLVVAHRRLRRDAGELRAPRAGERRLIREALGARRPPRLRIAAVLALPTAFRGEIWLPERALRELTRGELRAVLAHELAHLRRHDVPWRWFAALCERVLFFQPLNRLAASRLRQLSECLCDESALAAGSGVELASALLAVSRWMDGELLPATAAALMDEESLAVRRVRRLLDGDRPRTQALPGAVRLVAPLLVCVGLGAVAPGVARAAPVYTIQALDPAGPFQLRLHADGSGIEWTPRPALLPIR
jgi:beta-lactamase regulating signal transducer with metallopeptidase domain